MAEDLAETTAMTDLRTNQKTVADIDETTEISLHLRADMTQEEMAEAMASPNTPRRVEEDPHMAPEVLEVRALRLAPANPGTRNSVSFVQFRCTITCQQDLQPYQSYLSRIQRKSQKCFARNFPVFIDTHSASTMLIIVVKDEENHLWRSKKKHGKGERKESHFQFLEL
jgi:hypothetical protein